MSAWKEDDDVEVGEVLQDITTPDGGVIPAGALFVYRPSDGRTLFGWTAPLVTEEQVAEWLRDGVVVPHEPPPDPLADALNEALREREEEKKWKGET